jgi:hypothetical protein
MNREKLVEAVQDMFPDPEQSEGILLADGLEDAFVGVATQFNSAPMAVYDYDACLMVLMGRDGMTYEEAEEFMSYNVTGAWKGKQTPLFLRSLKPIDPVETSHEAR